MIEMGKALNMFMRDNKTYPADISVLEIDYYPNGVPEDPFTRQPFTYKTDGQKFTLTCLGKDQAKGGEEPNEIDIFVTEQGLVENE